MNDVMVIKNPINAEALDAALRAALGNATTGVSTGNGQAVVHLTDSTTPAQEEQARQIVLAHDPALLTPRQQAEATRQQQLAQARATYGTSELDLAAYSGQSALIQQLAGKIAWLEREIANLRGPLSG